MLSVVRVATIFLPQIEITWRDPSAAITGNTASEQEDREEDNARSERLFGYDPDRDVNVWDEYQAAMEDPMLAY